MSIVAQKLQDLYERGSESSDALEELCQLASLRGLSEPEFNMVLDVIFDHNSRSSFRHTLISKCLVPQAHYVLSPDVIYRIIGSIGIPQVYFRNERQLRLKRLPPASQQLLLLWLISSLHLFGNDVFAILGRLLPTLFGLLSFEYVRGHITTLIVVALSQFRLGKRFASGSFMPRVKKWHVSLVSDLAVKFPFDSSLRFLLSYMSSLQPDRPAKADAVSSSKSSPLVYPDQNITQLGSSFPRHDSQHIKDAIQTLFDSFGNSAAKRRKVAPASLQSLDILELSPGVELFPITSVESLTTLVNEFDRISFSNPGSLFTVTSANDRLRRVFVSLKLLSSSDSDPITKKFLQATIHRPLSTAASSITMPHFLKFSPLGRLKRLQKPVSLAVTDGKIALASKIDLLHLIDVNPHCINTIWDTLQKEGPSASAQDLHHFLNTIGCVLLRAYELKAKYHHSLGFFPVMESLVPKIFQYYLEQWPELGLSVKLQLLSFLRLMRRISPADIAQSDQIGWLFPKPSLLYQMVVSPHPVIASEAYGYLAFLKTIKLKDDQHKELLTLRNNYVMDSINFVWRDMAFKYEENSYNKGMYLDNEFVKTLAGLDFFTYSELMEFKTVGSLSHGPAFAYLCAQILWKLEDQHEEVTKRHPGPFSEESISRIQQDLHTQWLPMSYFEVKVSILNELDAMGFTGLCDFLFSSLRPLHGHRLRGSSGN